jgi:hypothetical protein
MSYFAVAHRTVRQANIFAAGMDKAVWILGHQHIIYSGIATLDGIIFIFSSVGIMTPPVADN